jgi:hypothetical protein
MEENQKEIQRQFRQQQEKYVYYVLALSVSAIAFAIYKTSGLPLKWSQVPLALSVISWGISIFCGLRFIKYVISTLYANNTYFDILAGRHPDLGNDPEKISAGVKGITQAMESNGEKAQKYFSWQGRLFYFGIILFIIWHVLEMCVTSKIIS